MGEVVAGRFELIDPVGAGGAGVVWRAWDGRLDRLCAAKVLRQRESGALVRFVREQSVRLRHPHLLCPYAWVAEDDFVLLAMDLVRGRSVAVLVNDFGPLPARYAAELLNQLLAGLGAVHAAGLVHRDVKPSNLLLEATGTGRPVLRLGDFGIALAVDEPRLTRQGMLVGTPGYLPADVVAGADPGPAQDLYAAGVVTWQLLTGRDCPADGVAPDVEPPDRVDPAMWQLMRALLGLDGARLGSAEAAAAALRPVLAAALTLPARTADDEPIEVFDHLGPAPDRPTRLLDRPSAATPAIGRPARPAVRARIGRRRALMAAAALGGAVAIGSVTAVLASGGDPAGTTPGGPTSSVGAGSQPAGVSSVPSDPAPRAGEQCGWQEEGDQAAGVGGRLVQCRQRGGGQYRWEPVS
jgi:eukaryotic-like serine/threonine-protein kinase